MNNKKREGVMRTYVLEAAICFLIVIAVGEGFALLKLMRPDPVMALGAKVPGAFQGVTP